MRRLALPMLAAVALALAAPAAAQSPADSLARSVAAYYHQGGGSSGALIVDSTTGAVVLSRNADVLRIPASVEKLYTTSTALARYGAGGRLRTSVLSAGSLDASGVWHGDLYLRGGCDPTFGSARFDRYAYGAGATVEQLAGALAARGIKLVDGRILGDESAFDTLRGTAFYGFATSIDIGGPLSALAYDRGLANQQGSAFQTRPALSAAAALQRALGARHIKVTGRAGTAPTPHGTPRIASVSSPTLATIVRLTLLPSDNWFAEMLLKGLGSRFGGAGSSAAGARVVRGEMSAIGIAPSVLDGSGLDRGDGTSPRQLVDFLRSPLASAALRAALPVAGVSGTLAGRMQGTAAAGHCEAKTGTLHDVSALAGYCQARDGHEFVFALLENHASPVRARAAQDRIAAALAAYDG